MAVIALAGLLPVATADAAATVTRIGGADRYATAAALSSVGYAPGVPAAIVASGEDFPDALAAGPIGAKYGVPVLLTRGRALSIATAQELDRLKPKKIIVVGGTGSISEATLAQLAQHTGGAVDRIAGVDRYDTAATLSRVSFTAPVHTVVVASGSTFTDALTGGPAAGSAGGPVLLVPTSGTLPTVVATELQRLAPQTILLVGGASSVDVNVQSQLQGYGAVVRQAGGDRYATGVAVSSGNFVSATKVFLASGQTFPDALAGGAPAGQNHAPLLLVDPSCIPAAVNAEIDRLGASSIIVLGGTASVSAAVAARTVCGGPSGGGGGGGGGGGTPPVATFGDGGYRVGTDIAPGIYRTRASSPGCVYLRLRSFTGDADTDIITGSASDDQQVVDIKASDAGFYSDSCGTWTKDLSAITTSKTAPFHGGSYIVNTDIAPGTWTAPGGEDCYWERESGFGSEASDVIASDEDTTPDLNPVVTIAPTDVGFFSDSCGTWTKVG